MKFKKIEIQAFRAYDKVEDSTFDFMLSNNEAAEFISIYAPNGFGKTSFYDAVEWGVTQNIHRFLKKQKFNIEFTKSEKYFNKDANQFNLLRNRYSNDQTASFVKLDTTNPKIVGQSLTKPRKGQYDYKFDISETVRPYFQEVILSQEWIDAFLKEDNPNERYETFIKYFGDKELSNYYKIVVALIGKNEDIITDLIKQAKGLQLDLKFSGDKDLLSGINELINKINEDGYIIDLVELTSTEVELLNLETTIAKHSAICNSNIQRSTKIIDDIERIFTGSEGKINLKDYYLSIEEVRNIAKRNEYVLSNIASRQELTKLKKEADRFKSAKDEKLKQLDKLENIIALFPEFNSTNQQLTNLNLRVVDLRKQQNTYEQIRIETEEKVNISQSKLDSINILRGQLEKDLKSIPGINDALSNYNTSLLKLNNTNEKIENAITSYQNDIRLLEEEILDVTNSENALKDPDNYTLLAEKNSDHSEKLDELLALYHKCKTVNSDLERINGEIFSHDSLKQELLDFIVKGIEIMNQSQQSKCPLCTYQYKSFEDLAESISSNNYLEQSAQQLFFSKNLLEKNKLDLESQFNNELKSLVNDMRLKRNLLEERRNSKIADYESLLKDLDRNSSESKNIEGRIGDILGKINNQHIQEWESELREKIITANLDAAHVAELLNTEGEKLRDVIQSMQSTTKDISFLSDLLVKHSSNEVYAVVKNYFKDTLDKAEYDLKYLMTEKDKISIELRDMSENIDSIITKVTEIESEIDNEAIDNYNVEVQNNKKSALQRDQSYLEQFVQTHFGLEINSLDEKRFSEELNSLREKSKVEISNLKTKLQNYQLLSGLHDIVRPYLQYEKAKASEVNLKERINFLQKKVMSYLLEEKRRTAEYLESMINSFFYEGLINKIYGKIDPHPTYKKIIFKCDFTEEKPQLNVFVAEEHNELFLIPNLYFSTAQLNILSLSIFLAKALHAKDEDGVALDCIFIDDPIQSMDSINVLSTIDLLRSIMLNQKKQIVLSTHDENFHELLKKKMPQNIFKSKFIELESFGKVKQGAQSY